MPDAFGALYLEVEAAGTGQGGVVGEREQDAFLRFQLGDYHISQGYLDVCVSSQVADALHQSGGAGGKGCQAFKSVGSSDAGDEAQGSQAVRGVEVAVLFLIEPAAPYAFRYTNEAYRAGVKIAAGTDYADMTKDGYKSVFLKELDWLADSCGMSIPDVLRAATTVGAEILRESGKLGIIREGAEADLLVLRKNPLESLAALKEQEALFIDGKRVK